ncbi:MAG: alpha/beta hydrolase [Woeseiaceae bacterium]|nr:alpha/beta hydrolase [Woeseiaceae bacterium]
MTRPPDAELLMLSGPAGRLEAVLETPADGKIDGCAIVCHPHPRQGGTMHNKVAHMLARAFVNRQMAALRFNFRGVGKSEGLYDEARGELQDALAAARWLQGRYAGLPLWFGGFSFGAAIAIRAAAEFGAAGLVSVAPAVSRFAGGMSKQPACPWLIVHGDKDELVNIGETIEWVQTLGPGPVLEVFEDTGHFFHGRLLRLRSAVENFIGGVRGQ